MTTLHPRQALTQFSGEQQQFHPVLQRVLANRGISSAADLEYRLADLLPYHNMKGIEQAVDLLLPVVCEQKKILIVGDFDVDGATSTAIAIRALRQMGATEIDYLVPNRFDFGYGLSPELVAVALQYQPDLIMTVDNGIASVDGVAAANNAGIDVLVTDHHLPADTLPQAAAIVNPNQPGCEFASKAACGCTVVFYLMLALRARLIERGWLQPGQVNLAALLDFVALATVADVVKLDNNNQILVEQGLRRIRSGHGHAGINALLAVAKRNPARIVSSDFGFAVGPRLNAAGRLDDISLGIECLLIDDPLLASQYATELDQLNRSRREIEQGMQDEAMRVVERFNFDDNLPVGLALFQADWHQGVIGILASRIKEKVHRPVVIFAEGEQGELKGSARSIAGLHLRDALDQVDKQNSGLIKKFGGHAMAAGLTLHSGQFERFSQAFTAVCEQLLTPQQLTQNITTDGELSSIDFNLDLAEQLRWRCPWGQGFEEPVFQGEFRLVSQRIVGERHLKLVLQPLDSDLLLDAIIFNVDLKCWPNMQAQRVLCAYQLDVNEFRGERNVQLMLRYLQAQ